MNDKQVILTKSDVSKAENCALNTAQLNLILSATPKAAIQERPAKGGGTWKYVSGTYVKKVLNLAFGFNWSFEIKEYQFDLGIGQVFVQGRLTVQTERGAIVKEQFGRQDIKFKTAYENGKKVSTTQPLDLGNDLKGAATDALKKCASEFGIASDVYRPNEFKAVRILSAEEEDAFNKRVKIIELIKTAQTLSEVDSQYLDTILENDDVEKYDKAIRLLENHQPS